MALVSCPECGQQVSSAAPSCPHCGMVVSGGAAVHALAPGVVFASSSGAPAPEQTLWEGSPSLALVYGRILGLVVRAIVLIVIGYLTLHFGLPALQSISQGIRNLIEPRATMIAWGIAAVLFIAIVPSATGVFGAIAQIKNTHYRVTNQRILVERGVLSKSLQEIDMRSVDDTDFHQGLLERIFRIGDVSIVSTDKITPRIVLHGIHDPRSTREMIRATAYELSQRQLYTRST